MNVHSCKTIFKWISLCIDGCLSYRRRKYALTHYDVVVSEYLVLVGSFDRFYAEGTTPLRAPVLSYGQFEQ